MKNETDTLNDMIIVIENKRAMELTVLKEQFHITYESLKPINIIKSTFHEAMSSPDMGNGIVNNVIGIGTGFISKKLLVGSSHNPLKTIFGTILQLVISNVVSKHADSIKNVGENLMHMVLNFRRNKKKRVETTTTHSVYNI